MLFFIPSVFYRSWQFLRWRWGYDWLQTKPMDEMELDHNHSCPLHGERRVSLNCVGWDTVDDMLIVERSRSQLVLKEACVCFQGCFIFSLVKYKPLTYNKVYEYPDWAIGLGWCLALCSMICIPMVMVIKILQSEGPLIEVSWFNPLALWKIRFSELTSANIKYAMLIEVCNCNY